MSDTVALKAGLRAEALARRDALAPEHRAAASGAIAAAVLALPELTEAALVAGFWPIRSEVDTRALLEALHRRGQALALPVTRHPHLLFRHWRPGEPLERRPFGVFEPLDSAPEAEPRALLVPLAGFDRRGGRLGYGKGHYDRALAALEARGPLLTLGLAFAVQEAPDIPQEPHDRRLDCIVTEREVIRAA